MAAVTTFDTLNGLFKETYADNLENLLPKGLVIQQDLKWADKSKMPGNKFHQPVLLGHEHGFTYAVGSSTGDASTAAVASAGAFEISAAVAGRTADATIWGSQMLLRSQLDYESAARASSGGKRSFRRALDIVVENMFASSRKRMEIDYIYGGQPLCTVTSSTGSSPFACTVPAADWAAGFWAGMENCKVQAFSGTTYVGSYTVTDVDLTSDGTNYGMTLTEITTSGGSTLGTADLFYNSAMNPPCDAASGFTAAGKSSRLFDGLFTCMNKGAGDTLFGIAVTGNSLWAPNQVGTVGELTYEVITDAIAEVVAKGLDEDLSLYVAPKVWADLAQREDKYTTQVATAAVASDTGIEGPAVPKSIASKVIYGSGGGRRTIGSNGITFITQAGSITVKPSNFVKEGHGFMFAPRLWKRIGATDLTFRLPDRGDEFFLHLTEKAGYELRAYVNHALFTKAPAKGILLTGITS